MSDEQQIDDFLAHYGVKGMKWGVRKEKDGSGEDRASTDFSLKNPKVRRAAQIGVAVTAIAVTAFIASRYSDKNFNQEVVARGKAKLQEILEQPTDIIYMSKPHRGAGVMRNGMERTGLAFISKGGTKDFFEIFDRAGLNSDGFGQNTIRKMTNGDLAVLFEDLLGRVDSAGRTIPHAVFIPANQASGLDSLDDVLKKFGPTLEREYQSYLTAQRRLST